eukprot:scaffold8288_cov229-Pinguiococcus_pyrenoidosus.AAC.1
MTINGAEQLLGILLHVASLVALRELGKKLVSHHDPLLAPKSLRLSLLRTASALTCLHRGVQHFEGLRERPRKGVARVGRRLPSRVAHDPPQGRAQLRNGAKALERAVHVASIAEVHKASRQRLSGGGLLGRREVFHEGRGLHGLLDDLGSTHEADVRPIWQVFQAGVVLQNAFPAPSAHELLPRDRHASQLLQPLLEGQRRGAGVHFELFLWKTHLFIPLHMNAAAKFSRFAAQLKLRPTRRQRRGTRKSQKTRAFPAFEWHSNCGTAGQRPGFGQRQSLLLTIQSSKDFFWKRQQLRADAQPRSAGEERVRRALSCLDIASGCRHEVVSHDVLTATEARGGCG